MKPSIFAVLALLPAIMTAQIRPDPARYPASVAPLLTSTWGQRAPYNYMCPLVEPTPWGGYLPEEEHCRVGCVAVAIGQIMRYHRWPHMGTGEASVTYPLIGNNQNVFAVDFSQAIYDYDLMLDDYGHTDYTEEQGRGVAQLLYHCAVASKMIFGSTASATTNFATAEALSSHFQYDANRIKTLFRSQYNKEEWLDMIFKELTEGRPVFYEAVEVSFSHGIYAHSFVIDGYNAEGQVHVNWGWNGQQDGYYDIDHLNPGTYQFNFYQDMTIGIERPQSFDAVTDITENITSYMYYTIDGRKAGNDINKLPTGIYIHRGRKIAIK